jgi:rod shape-determining protein MreD
VSSAPLTSSLPRSAGELPAALRPLPAAVAAVALFAAVVLQLTVVNRLPLPALTQASSAAAPDLVLLLVTAIAVASTPLAGALTGFAAGLAVDVAPPAAHYAGEYALVFCLAGYGAARTVRAIYEVYGERGPVTSFTVMAGAVVAGEAGKAALGLLLTEPDVTVAAVSRVLPAALLYDLVLAPLAFQLVSLATRAVRRRGAGQELALAPGFHRERRLSPVFGNAGSGQVVFRQASLAIPRLHLSGSGTNYTDKAPRPVPRLHLSGSGTNYTDKAPRPVPRLHLSGSGTNYTDSAPRPVPRLRLSGSGANYAAKPPARRVPRLRFAAGPSQLRQTVAAYSPTSSYPLAGGRATKLNFAGDLPVRSPALSPAKSPGKNWLRRAVPDQRRAPAAPSRGWIAASGAGPGGRRGRAGGRPAAAPHGFGGGTAGSAAPLAVTPSRSAAEALAARSAPSGLSALSGAGTPLARGSGARGSGARGWGARGSGARGWGARGWATRGSGERSPRRGWLGYTGRASRTVLGSTVLGSTVLASTVLGSTVYQPGAGSHGPQAVKAPAFRRARPARGNWYTASPSGRWLRRSRNPWRKRRERLLRMVGVGR